MVTLITPFPCPFADEPTKKAAKRDKEKYAEKSKLTITQKPVKVSSGKSRDSYLIHLSDGTTTDLTGAARIAGISTKGMLKRINKNWRDKDIFGPWRRSGGAQKADLARLERGKFAWMKNDSRDYRLSRIPGPSRFEMGL